MHPKNAQPLFAATQVSTDPEVCETEHAFLPEVKRILPNLLYNLVSQDHCITAFPYLQDVILMQSLY
jgi:hypothetical protein